jgi:hypothetical protein
VLLSPIISQESLPSAVETPELEQYYIREKRELTVTTSSLLLKGRIYALFQAWR